MKWNLGLSDFFVFVGGGGGVEGEKKLRYNQLASLSLI